jgi:hypothetical protein
MLREVDFQSNEFYQVLLTFISKDLGSIRLHALVS